MGKKNNKTQIGIFLPKKLNDEMELYLEAYREFKSFKSKQNLCIDILEKYLPHLIDDRKYLESKIKERNNI